ncbi:MAG: response regulator transcription factor [Anaerolineae bacterium]|nr:response regulator transcription factor [Anaerolineae bacterium]
MDSASPTVPISTLTTKRTRINSSNTLTAREQQVAELAAQGQSNKQIASAMNLSVSTIQNHLQAVYRKLGVRSRSELSWRLQHLADSDD